MQAFLPYADHQRRPADAFTILGFGSIPHEAQSAYGIIPPLVARFWLNPVYGNRQPISVPVRLVIDRRIGTTR